MNKIVNGVANDYEFPMYYESNIKTSRDKTIGEDLSKQIIKMENVYVDLVRKKDKEIERLNENNQHMQEEMVRRWEKHDNLQERIDKAIDYIMTNHCLHLLDKSIINSKELIDILKGSDKE